MSKSFADVIASEKNGRRKVTHTLILSPDLNEEHARLNEELLDALGAEKRDRDGDTPSSRRLATKPRSTEIAEKMANLIEDNPDSCYDVVLEQARRSDWLKLRTEHPPREKVPMDGGLFNYETFPPAAVALCLLDPEPTPEVMQYLEDNLSNGEWEQLAMKVWTLNEGARDVPKSALASSIIASREND